jgi:putative transposase
VRKPFRLSPEVYSSGHCFSVTIVTSDRRPIFASASRATKAIACLRESAARFNAEIYAFCFMPDHLHLLARTPEGVRFDEFGRHFKQLSGFRLPREPGTVRVWQPSYYDHALRPEEALVEVASYIWDNPVRAGLVEEAGQYPFSGSIQASEAPDGPEGPGLRAQSDVPLRSPAPPGASVHHSHSTVHPKGAI